MFSPNLIVTNIIIINLFLVNPQLKIFYYDSGFVLFPIRVVKPSSGIIILTQIYRLNN